MLRIYPALAATLWKNRNTEDISNKYADQNDLNLYHDAHQHEWLCPSFPRDMKPAKDSRKTVQISSSLSLSYTFSLLAAPATTSMTHRMQQDLRGPG